jgi:hypothetical protein
VLLAECRNAEQHAALTIPVLAHIISLSHEAGLDSRLPDTLYAVYAAAVAAGLGAKELPAVYELFRPKRS